MAKKQHGGKREGAGRNPSDDPALQVSFYVKTSIIQEAGGMEAAKEVASNAIEKEAKKNKRNLKKNMNNQK